MQPFAYIIDVSSYSTLTRLDKVLFPTYIHCLETKWRLTYVDHLYMYVKREKFQFYKKNKGQISNLQFIIS